MYEQLSCRAYLTRTKSAYKEEKMLSISFNRDIDKRRDRERQQNRDRERQQNRDKETETHTDNETETHRDKEIERRLLVS